MVTVRTVPKGHDKERRISSTGKTEMVRSEKRKNKSEDVCTKVRIDRWGPPKPG